MAKKKPAESPVEGSGADQQPPESIRSEMAREVSAVLKSIHQTVAETETLIGKLTPEQINHILAQTESRSQRQWLAERLGLIVLAASVFLALAAICFLWTVSLSYNKPELVSDLIKMIGGLLGGLLGGYGLRGAVERRAKAKP